MKKNEWTASMQLIRFYMLHQCCLMILKDLSLHRKSITWNVPLLSLFFFFKTDILLKIVFPCNTCLQILSLYRLNKPWVLRWLCISTGVSYQFHIFFWRYEKTFICPCLVAVAWPNAKAFLNAEMCCVAAVISLYPKGLLQLSFLQHQAITCLAVSTEENSIQSQKEVTYLKRLKKREIISHCTSLCGQSSYLFPTCWGAEHHCSYCCFSYVEARIVWMQQIMSHNSHVGAFLDLS